MVLQVILMLTSDLDGQDERDRTCFANLLNLFVKELDMEKPDVSDICARTNKREVHLVIMRLLSKFLCSTLLGKLSIHHTNLNTFLMILSI